MEKLVAIDSLACCDCTLQRVLLIFLMSGGDGTPQIILIKWYSGQSHVGHGELFSIPDFPFKLDLAWLLSPYLSAQLQLIITDFYHVCYREALGPSVNLKLIKDTQLPPVLTWLFTFPSPFSLFILPSVPHCSLGLRAWADGGGARCLTPGGQNDWGVQEREMEGGRAGEAKVYSCGHGAAVQSALTCDKTAVTPLPELLVENHVHFFFFPRSLTLPAVDDDEKSPDVFLRLSSLPPYTNFPHF